jgi:hypothetical protein
VLKVKPLTWRHLLWLDIYQNAFLTSLTPDQLLQVNDIHLHVARFMWVLSPRWKPYSKFAHWRFNRLYKKTLYGRKNNTAEIVSAIHQFFEESIFDLKSESRGPQRKSYYSNATACAHALCHLYPSLSPDPTAPNAVIDLPLKIAGQLLRAHAKFENPKALLNNRTDVLEQNWLAELNENLKKN